MIQRAKVLLVDDDAAVREALVQTLELADYDPVACGSFVAAKDHIGRDFPGVILSDIRMPGRDGFHLLTYAREIDEDLPVVLLTGEGDIPMAVSAMDKGAFDFLEKPCAPSDLLRVLGKAVDARRVVLEARAAKALNEAGDPASRMIYGVSDLVDGLRARIRRIAAADAEVLVIGAPGTGISKVAEVIHLCSGRSRKPFEKRSASGLSRPALGEAMQAGSGGSLFLDEIDRMPADTQFSLVEHLEGGADVRLIAGCTVDLHQASEVGNFNSDLFYRLQVMTVRIPSLAERPEDIPVLYRHYVAQSAEQTGTRPPELTPEHLDNLMAQDWPGNARSLMSAAMRFVLGMQEENSVADGLGLAEQMARVERSLLIATLKRLNGRASEAAKSLKLPRKTFYDKLAKHGIRPEDYRI